MKRIAIILLAVLLPLASQALAGYSGPVTVTLPGNAVAKTLCAAGGGCDYTDPAVWVSERIAGQDLVAGNRSEVLQVKAGVYDFTINVPNATATTDTDHRIIVMAYPGDECTGPTVGARIIWTAPDAGEAIQLYNSWCYAYNLGVSRPSGNNAGSCGGAWMGGGSLGDPTTGGGLYGIYAWDIVNPSGNATAIEIETDGGTISQCYATDVSASGSATGLSLHTSPNSSISDSEAYSITGASAYGISVNVTSTNAILDSVAAHSISSLDAGAAAIGAALRIGQSNNVIAKNILGYSASAVNGNGVGAVVVTPSTGTSLFNCTFAKCQIGLLAYAVTAIATNVVSEQNTTANWSAISGSWTKTTCTDGGGVQFVDAAGGDFHLVVGDTVAKDQGTTLAGVATDGDGNPRPYGPAYDIGWDEYYVAPTGLPVDNGIPWGGRIWNTIKKPFNGGWKR